MEEIGNLVHRHPNKLTVSDYSIFFFVRSFYCLFGAGFKCLIIGVEFGNRWRQ